MHIATQLKSPAGLEEDDDDEDDDDEETEDVEEEEEEVTLKVRNRVLLVDNTYDFKFSLGYIETLFLVL